MDSITMHINRDVDNRYFPAPYSIDPLPDHLKLGMIAPGIAGILSALTTLTLILFIFWRLISWRKHYRTFVGYNQYVMLVLHLLIADFQQAAAFVVTWYWFDQNKVLSPTPACFAQGWLLHSGNLSSAFFVIAIAIHTFITAVAGWKIDNYVFYGCIIFAWVLAYVLTFAGVLLHPNDYFVRAGAWCWVNSDYENERLFLHYLWIFLVEFTTIALYAIIFVNLRRRTKRLFKNHRENQDGPSPKTVKAVNRITRLMTLYPLAYIVCTLPISFGRMWSMANKGKPYSDEFFLTAGTLLASCGWVDVLLYTLTRKRLLEETMPNRSLASNSGNDAITTTRTVTVQEFNKEGGKRDMQENFLTREDQTDFNAKNIHFEVNTLRSLPSRTGSVDPILRDSSPVASWQDADKHYALKQMLEHDRQPEFLEMGALEDGRLAPVPKT